MKNREKEERKKELIGGLKDGAPIALGYLSVSFSVGILAAASGFTVFQGAFMSLTNVTSAGQFAGIQVIAAGGTILELMLTQLIINLRYALMSLSLSQKLSEKVTLWQRFVIAFANTDEIFAVAMSHAKSLTFPYLLGLEILPVLGWTGGTVLGGAAGQLLPPAVSSALSVALYGMFIAVVVPAAVRLRPVLIVAVLAAVFRCVLYYVPVFSGISAGISIIICTTAASLIGAVFFPVREEAESGEN